MMLFKKLFHWPVIVVFSVVVSVLLSDQGICSSSFPLDEETVFCIYYKMSGEYMDDQDLEDLCYTLGRPTFTAYKPAQMFMKNSLRELRGKLVKRMKDYNENSMFKWNFQCNLMPINSEINSIKLTFLNNEMPQPTPFIRAEMSRNGRRLINRQLALLDPKTLSQKKEAVLNINIYLKPETIDYQLQKRNIAREDVFLPLRCVIFRPVKIEISPLKHPEKIVLSHNIPDSSGL